MIIKSQRRSRGKKKNHQRARIQFNFQSSVLLCLCRDESPGQSRNSHDSSPFQISPSVKLPSSLPPLPLYDQPPISPFTSPETSTPPALPRSPSAALNGEHKPPPPTSSHKGPLSTHSKQRGRSHSFRTDWGLRVWRCDDAAVSPCRSDLRQEPSVSGIHSAAEIHA